MPSTCELNTNLDIFEIAHRGPLTSSCVLKTIDALEAAPHHLTPWKAIWDCSTIDTLLFDRARLGDLAHLLRGTCLRAGHRKRIAFIATDGPGLTFSTAMHEALEPLSMIDVGIFSDRAAALAFLTDSDRQDGARQTG